MSSQLIIPVVLCLFFLLCSPSARAQGPADAVLFVKGERVSSIQNYLDRHHPVKNDVIVDAEGSGVDVAGVTPSLQDIIQSFRSGVIVSEPLVVSSENDLEADLKAKLGNSQRPLLLISENGRVRLMELRADEPQLVESQFIE